MIYIRFSIILLLFFALTGCNAVKKMGTSDDYNHADSRDKVLILPKEMQKIKINDNYPVPRLNLANTSAGSAHILILPPGSKVIK